MHLKEKNMVIKKLVLKSDGWYRFNLNVGGFTIRNCRWHPPTRRIFFPRRYDLFGPRRPHRVIFAYGTQVKRLRNLLESGLNESNPRKNGRHIGDIDPPQFAERSRQPFADSEWQAIAENLDIEYNRLLPLRL